MKVAFSVAFVSGCSSPASTGGSVGSDDLLDPTDEPGPSEPGTSYGSPKPAPDQGSWLAAAYQEKADSTPKPASCEEVVNAAFPTEGDYPGVNQSVAAEVQSCCLELLTDSQGAMASHRWDCCANVDLKANPDAVTACTPWGPPVPPVMRRRGVKATTPPDAWLEVA